MRGGKWWILASMTTSMSMVFIDVTVLPVALPTLQRELHISDLGLQWIVNAYTFMLSILVLGCGRLGDIWGLKKAFCFGLFLFTFASLLCGFSHSESFLIGARALQGIGGAFLIPATPGIVFATFPPHERGKASGILISISAVFLTIGPLIGGFLTQYLSWRYVFWINLPIACIGFLLTFFSVPPIKGLKEPVDWAGFCTLSIGIGALVIAFMEAESWGWLSPITLSLFALGLLLPYFFFKVERKISHPILDLSIIRTKSFLGGAGSVFCNQFLIMVTVFWAIYFQEILGFSPTLAGVYAFIANAPVLIAAPLGGHLLDRFGPRLPVMIGFSLVFFSLIWFVYISPPSHISLLFITLIPFSIGIPLIFTPSYVSILNEVPKEKRGLTSGITSSLRQFSSTIGLAIFNTLFLAVQVRRLNHFLTTNPGTSHLSAPDLEGVLSHSPKALKALNGLSPSESTFVLTSAKTAFLNGFTAINLGAALIALLGFFIAWRLMQNHPTKAPH